MLHIFLDCLLKQERAMILAGEYNLDSLRSQGSHGGKTLVANSSGCIRDKYRAPCCVLFSLSRLHH